MAAVSRALCGKCRRGVSRAGGRAGAEAPALHPQTLGVSVSPQERLDTSECLSSAPPSGRWPWGTLPPSHRLRVARPRPVPPQRKPDCPAREPRPFERDLEPLPQLAELAVGRRWP